MKRPISKEKPDKELDQVYVEELIKDLSLDLDLTFDSCAREFAEDPNRMIMTLRKGRNEEIVLRYPLNGSLVGRKESIKQALLNHPQINN